MLYPRPYSGRKTLCISWRAFACLAFALLIGLSIPAHTSFAQTADGETMQVSEADMTPEDAPLEQSEFDADDPSGFDDAIQAAEDQEGDFTAFDFYVGGLYYGLVYGTYTPEWFKFNDPESTLDIIPPLNQPENLVSLFLGRVPEFRAVESVGEIEINFDEFAIYVEVDKNLTLTRLSDAQDSLPEAEQALSIRNEFIGAGSASTTNGFDSENLTLSHESLLSYGRTSIISSGSASSAAGYEITDAAISQELQTYGQETVASIGLLQSEGQRFSRSIDFFGFNLRSNERLRLRDELQQATRLEIFLRSRSLVEVFRDSEASGRTLYSQNLDFGTVILDTARFPEGSYNVEIVITDSAGQVTRETRPFVKTDNLVPQGPGDIDVSIGIARDDVDSVEQGVLYGAYRKRVLPNLELGASGLATADDMIFEGTLRSEHPYKVFGFMGLLETQLSAAINQEGEMAGVDGSLLFRGERESLFLSGNKTYNRRSAATTEISPFLSARESLNATLSKSFKVFGRQSNFALSAQWSDTPNADSTYRFGPDISFPLYRSDDIRSDLRLQYTATERDNQAVATVTWRRSNGPYQQNYRASIRDEGDETSGMASARFNFDGTGGKREGWQGKTRAFLGLRLDPAFSNTRDKLQFVDTEAEYRGEYARVSSFFNHNIKDNEGRFGGDFQSTLIWSPGEGFEASGDNLSSENAYAFISVDGMEGRQVIVYVNNSPRRYMLSGETALVRLPLYDTATVRVESAEDGAVSIKEGGVKLTGYPGNILYQRFTALRPVFVFGQLLNEAGEPYESLRFEKDGRFYYTDPDGFFNLEYLVEDAEPVLKMVTPRGTCDVPLIDLSPEDLIYEAGQVACTLSNDL